MCVEGQATQPVYPSAAKWFQPPSQVRAENFAVVYHHCLPSMHPKTSVPLHTTLFTVRLYLEALWAPELVRVDSRGLK